MEAGDELLQSVKTCVDSVMPTLNPAGQNRVHCDVETLVTGIAGLKSQLDTRLMVIQRHHALWCKYDTEHEAFTSWITTQLEELQAEPLKQTTLEQKKTALDIQQV